ncbi:MAG: hypothetical protein AAGA92_14115 [Planctomycetota bacterium]
MEPSTPTEVRIVRLVYVDPEAEFRLALAELESGWLAEAHIRLRGVLAAGLRHKWNALTGEHYAIDCPDRLLNKMRSKNLIDKWTLKLGVLALNPPESVEAKHVELLAILVETLVFDRRPSESKIGGAA